MIIWSRESYLLSEIIGVRGILLHESVTLKNINLSGCGVGDPANISGLAVYLTKSIKQVLEYLGLSTIGFLNISKNWFTQMILVNLSFLELREDQYVLEIYYNHVLNVLLYQNI